MSDPFIYTEDEDLILDRIKRDMAAGFVIATGTGGHLFVPDFDALGDDNDA